MTRQEGRLETHDDGVKFVMDVFRSMGGRVLPPIRPCHIPRYTPLAIERDNFFMDFENSCLECNWHTQPQPFDSPFDSLSFYWNKPHPKGPKRHEDPEWAAMIQSQVYPHHSDVDWEEYVEWVENGGGDEWFQEEQTLFCTKHQQGPLDVWYDCDECCQEETRPTADRLILVPLGSLNGH